MALYRTLLLCLTVLVTGILAGSGVAGAQELCTTADDLFDAKLYRQARAQYQEALKEEATQRCAQEGLSKVAEIQGRAHAEYTLGRSYEAAKQTNEAGAHYRASLEIDPTYEPALVALDGILTAPTQTPNPTDDEKFRLVRALLGLGLRPEAEEQLKKIVGENPSINVPPDVRAQFTGDLRRWHEAKDFFGPWLRTIGEIVLLLVIGYFLIRALWLRFAPATRISVMDFEASSEGARGYKGMSSIVEDALSKSDEGEAVVRRDLVDGSVQPASVKLDLSSLLPTKFALLSTVLEWLLPSKVIKLTGIVHAPEPGSRGAGVTLSLLEGTSGKVHDTVTIWQKDFEGSELSSNQGGQTSDKGGDTIPYSRLAEVAAIWAQFRINKLAPPDYLKTERIGLPIIGQHKYAIFTRLGTDSWESYALFRMGVLSSRRNDLRSARQLYYRALDKDDKNRGALFNLGVIEVIEHNYTAAIDLLQRARASSEMAACFNSQEVGGTIVLEMVWYNTMYQLAAVHSYMGEEDPNWHHESLGYVTELVDTLERTLTFLADNKTPEDRSNAIWNTQRNKFSRYQEMLDVGRLEKALVDFREGCLLAKAVILVANNEFDAAEELYENEIMGKGKGYEPLTLYNLACYYSQVGEKKRAGQRRIPTQGATVEAVANDGNVRDTGKTNIVAIADDGTAELEAALKYLDASFEIEARKSDLDWAVEDPSLKGVRTDALTYRRFLTIISKYEGQADEGMPLSVVTSIGRYHASLLKEEKITKPIELLQRTMTQEARKELAGKMGVSQAALQNWIATAELMVALDIEAPVANLLQAAGVSSLAQLKDANEAQLSSRMLDRNAGEFHVRKHLLPSLARTAQWIEIAKSVNGMAAPVEAASITTATTTAPNDGSNGLQQVLRSLADLFAGGAEDSAAQGTR